jgi:hypothetical protein
MNNLFEPFQIATDGKYLAVRDDSRYFEQKSYLEELWQLFSPYADPHFKSELASQFQPRFWEMYLACGFIQLGFELIPRRSSYGPDIQIKLNNRNIWIEATAPDAGKGADALILHDSSEAFIQVPEEQIILRLANSISKKCQKYAEYISSNTISANDAYVIALNGFNIPYAFADDEIPYIVKSVLPFGNLTVTYDFQSEKVIKQFYQYRNHIQKKSKSKVPTTTFQDPAYSFISGVIYSRAELWNLPTTIGDDFLFIHNPIATPGLEKQWFGRGVSFWLEDNQLKYISNSRSA